MSAVRSHAFGFPRKHCVVLVVTAKKQLADDRAALLGNRCHERRGASRSWMVLSVFSTHAYVRTYTHSHTNTHSQPTHAHPSRPTRKQTTKHARAFGRTVVHFTYTRWQNSWVLFCLYRGVHAESVCGSERNLVIYYS